MATVPAKREKTALTLFSEHIGKLQEQMAKVLPKHLTPDRMCRLALSQFNSDKNLQKCTFSSIAESVMVAAAMGLEIGVSGHGWIVPYKETATFVPGWQGLVDLLNRSGQASAWTGAVYKGDSFDWGLGDSPFVKHRPCDERDDLQYVYAIGRVQGSEYPVVEVWSKSRVEKHRDRYNKVGKKHYSLKDDNNFEMYARKVALLQVLKYLPKSVQLSAAVQASHAADQGDSYTIDADFSVSPVPRGNAADEATDEPPVHDGSPKSYMQAKQAAKQPEKLTPEQKFLQMIEAAETEGACRSLGAALKAEKTLSADTKKALFARISERVQELLTPEDEVETEPVGEGDDGTAYTDYVSAIIECESAEDAQGLAVDIEQNDLLDAEQRSGLVEMLTQKFQ